MPKGPRPVPLTDRIRASVVIDPTGCWIWQRSSDRYGHLWIGSRTDGTRRFALAHRVSYEAFVGPIPDGLTIDHLCGVTTCVNPDHLEPVTVRANVLRSSAPSAQQARQTHCKRNHEFTPENTYMNKGKRYCRACQAVRRETLNR